MILPELAKCGFIASKPENRRKARDVTERKAAFRVERI